MSFLFINKTLRLNNLKIRTIMNAKISVFVICVEAIMYLLLYNLQDYTFKHVSTADFWMVQIFYHQYTLSFFIRMPKIQGASWFLSKQGFWTLNNSYIILSCLAKGALVFLRMKIYKGGKKQFSQNIFCDEILWKHYNIL